MQTSKPALEQAMRPRRLRVQTIRSAVHLNPCNIENALKIGIGDSAHILSGDQRRELLVNLHNDVSTGGESEVVEEERVYVHPQIPALLEQLQHSAAC